MKTNKKKIVKQRMSKGKMMAVGAGIVAVGAGAYALLGPSGKRNQVKVKAFAKKMEKKAMPTIRNMGKIAERKAMPQIKKARQIVKKTVVDLKKRV